MDRNQSTDEQRDAAEPSTQEPSISDRIYRYLDRVDVSRHQQIEPGDEVFCRDCGVNRTATVIDVGYGLTEYWGSVSNHVDMRTVCNYCESEDIFDLDSVPEQEEEAA